MKQKASSSDHGMSGFMFGLTIGVLGALLLGTEEGRKLTKEIIDSLPEDFRHLEQYSSKEHVPDFSPPLDMPETTPHHVVMPESPPPPPPSTERKPDYLYPSE